MSFKEPHRSPFHRNSPNHCNDQGRTHVSTNSTGPIPAWGSPAVSCSPSGNTFKPQTQRPSYNQYSPRGKDFSHNSQFNNSPRGNSAHNKPYNMSPRGNSAQNKPYNMSPRNNSFSTPSTTHNNFSSPNDVFKTPQSPLNRSYTSPGAYNGFNSSGKRSYNQRFQQNSRRGGFNTQRGGSSIENYYHFSMIEDPWKNTSPVLVSTRS
ncbi:Hypothetical predicted protein [Mytilus galloprovincialis]|uniref:Uncharacterized protein n=1 Tax=Mytilus galloprovincialis TaxID=29158 RepID=A0A8B6H3H1_MYTGA|nr:Hypothetical predicted protein [Mytilus galloprovincialis]